MNNISMDPYRSYKDCYILGKKEGADNSVNYRKIPRDLYKYCSIDTAIAILENQKIRFSIPSVFDDKREGNLYSSAKELLSKNINAIFDKNIEFYTCCFTTAKISEAFTQIYSAQALYSKILVNQVSHDVLSIEDFIRSNSIGICFRLNRLSFKKSLLKTLRDTSVEQLNGFKLIEGYMQYCSPYTIDKITNNSSQYADGLVSDNYLYNLMTFKNKNFSYEEEFRFFIAVSKIDDKPTLDLTININDCLDQMFVFTNSAVFSLDVLCEAKQKIIKICKKHGIRNRGNLPLVEILNVYENDSNEY